MGRFSSQPAPRNIVIKHNRIHGSTELPWTTEPRDLPWPGRNPGDGASDLRQRRPRIQLYPGPRRTQITGNVINGDGDGIIVAGLGDSAPMQTRIEGNIV